MLARLFDSNLVSLVVLMLVVTMLAGVIVVRSAAAIVAAVTRVVRINEARVHNGGGRTLYR